MKDSPKEYAEELIKFFLPKMYCYFGSGMLSNHYDEKVALDNAKECALKSIREIIKSIEALENTIDKLDNVNLSIFSAISYQIEYWEDVEKEIKKYGVPN